MFGNWPEFRGHVKSGKLVALGMATAQVRPMRPTCPRWPSRAWQLESNSWNGLLAPRATPDAMVQRLNAEVQAALKAPAVVQAFKEGGIAALPGTPERFAAFIASEIDKYAQVIRKAGITA
jgi:tripartite-type tricarboxylate transporter receptor subunit TctC